MTDLYRGLAEILEVEPSSIDPHFELNSGSAPWDSLAIVSTLALVDELFNVMIDGKLLSECTIVAQIEALIGQATSA
jgi:acyl carrier protein